MLSRSFFFEDKAVEKNTPSSESGTEVTSSDECALDVEIVKKLMKAIVV